MIHYTGELTEEEKRSILKYKDSLLFALLKKAVASEYNRVGHSMDVAEPEELLVLQGKRKGLLTAYNVMTALVYDLEGNANRQA